MRNKGHVHKSDYYGAEITFYCTENHSLPNEIARQYRRLIARVRRLRTRWRAARRQATFNRIAMRKSTYAPPTLDPSRWDAAKTTGERLVEILGPDGVEALTDAQLEKIALEASHFRQESGTRPAILNVETDSPQEG